MTVIDTRTPDDSRAGANPLLEEPASMSAMVVLVIGVVFPFIGLLAAVPIAWGWGLSWLDITIGAVFYLISGFGVTVGFHRYFTHKAFKAQRWLRVVLAVAGSLSVEGPLVQWVADHRRHHTFADRQGDPHSPWRFGATAAGLAKGLSSPIVDGCSSASPPTARASRPISWLIRTPIGWTGSSRRWLSCLCLDLRLRAAC
jgi:stearoyl-CoA desaturase (Delta-9 desaturase)